MSHGSCTSQNFIAHSTLSLEDPHGDTDEVLDSGAFTFAQMQQMDISTLPLINAALATKLQW